jgi:cytochrome c oxidase cbb3-type subunit I/II
MAFGMIYWLVPRMSKGFSAKLSNSTLIGTLGILYTLPMYVAGFTSFIGNNLILMEL